MNGDILGQRGNQREVGVPTAFAKVPFMDCSKPRLLGGVGGTVMVRMQGRAGPTSEVGCSRCSFYK